MCEAFDEARTAGAATESAAADGDGVRRVGHRFRETFLALGGARHAGEVFREFRGRDPSVRPLLRQLGLDAPTPTSAAAAGEPQLELSAPASSSSPPPVHVA